MPRAKSNLGLTLAMALSVLAQSCASYTDETKEIRSAYVSSAYDSALSQLEKSALKEQTRNRLLYRLEKAMILDRDGSRKEARNLLVEADKLVDELYTESISKSAVSMIYNDSTTDYAGEDFEKVAIHLILALSFIDDKDFPAAIVEARRINSRLNEINQKYDKGKNRYGEDAFARYLAAMIYEARDETDSAIIDYTAALKIYESVYAPNFALSPPKDLIEALSVLLEQRKRRDQLDALEKRYPKIVAAAKKRNPDQGELVVIHQAGTIAIKQAQDFMLPIGGQVVRFSFPVIKNRGAGLWGTTGVEVQGLGLVRGELAQNMDAIASETLEDRRTRLLVKEGARLLIKGQLTRQAEENFGVVGWLAGTIYGAATETADTRSWTLLPSAFYVTRTRLNPGSYALTIKTNGRIGQVQTVKIERGRMTILRDQG